MLEFFKGHAQKAQRTLAGNAVLGLRDYGLLEEDAATPTQLASEMLVIAEERDAFYERFAEHILLNLRGIDVLDTVEAMQMGGERVTLHSLRNRLLQRGLETPRGAVHLSSLRLWLAQSGVFDISVKAGPRLWRFNAARVRQILGIGLDAIDKLSDLDRSQRAFLRALTRFPEEGPLVANKVADMASMLYGAHFDHKKLPQAILVPLRDLGYIEVEKTTKGRGAKPYHVTRTAKLCTEISGPILDAAAKKAGLVPREVLQTPLSQILDDLKASNTHKKGRALELLVIYLTRLIDLDFKGWRVRSAATGGAEVEVIVEGARFIFSRWQVQAENTSSVRLGDVAKEIGLSRTFIYSNVVMIVTTGDFTQEAYSYADHVMKTCNLNVILLARSDIGRIAQDPTNIAAILNDKAQRAMKIKERRDYFAEQG